MTHLRDRLEGVCLAEEYGLQMWLGGDEAGVSFLTSFGPDARRAMVKLIPEVPSTAEEQLAQWHRAIQLGHAHLLPLLDCGRSQAAGEPVLYAVFEYPDDTLAAALEHRALSPTEVREVLIAVLGALRYIHAQGLVHTAVDPAHVVAVGDRIKLSSETLRESGRGATHADDVRSLGAMLYELLTRHRLAGDEAPDLSEIDDPLRTTIRHTVEPDPALRWTVAEIVIALHAEPAPAASAPQPVPAAPEPAAPAPAAPIPEPAPIVLPVPVEVPPAVRPLARAGATPRPRRVSFPKWIYAVYAAIVVGGILLVNHNRSVPASSTPPVSVSASRPAPAQPPPAQPAPEAAVVPPPPVVAAPAAPVAASADREVSGSRMWRVIAYTYSGHTAAEKKAQRINQKWPGFHAEVFTPKSRPGMYLVALGGRMTRDEAVSLQRKARSRELPRDTYVQNYTN